MFTKQYLGDGVYLQFDGFAYVLTTEDGVSVSNTIVLEPSVLTSLIRETDIIKAQIQNHTAQVRNQQDLGA